MSYERETLYGLSPEERRSRIATAQRLYRRRPPSKKRDRAAWFAWWRVKISKALAERQAAR